MEHKKISEYFLFLNRGSIILRLAYILNQVWRDLSRQLFKRGTENKHAQQSDHICKNVVVNTFFPNHKSSAKTMGFQTDCCYSCCCHKAHACQKAAPQTMDQYQLTKHENKSLYAYTLSPWLLWRRAYQPLYARIFEVNYRRHSKNSYCYWSIHFYAAARYSEISSDNFDGASSFIGFSFEHFGMLNKK